MASTIPSGTAKKSASHKPPGIRKRAAKRSPTSAGLDLRPRLVPRPSPSRVEVGVLLAVVEVVDGHVDRRVVLDQAGERLVGSLFGDRGGPVFLFFFGFFLV